MAVVKQNVPFSAQVKNLTDQGVPKARAQRLAKKATNAATLASKNTKASKG